MSNRTQGRSLAKIKKIKKYKKIRLFVNLSVKSTGKLGQLVIAGFS
ncbi:hypothetical protein [Geitlerinema sp. PCC 9228]|nr:hypothetical protein [Geitlerinema sp. PCC 9228]